MIHAWLSVGNTRGTVGILGLALCLVACGQPQMAMPDGRSADVPMDTRSTPDVLVADVPVAEDVATEASVTEADVVTCGADEHLCAGLCVSNTSAQTCGTRCTPCTAIANARPECIAGACRSVCNAGHHPCGTACASDTSVLSCGSRCTACPVPANGTATCTAGACSFVCSAGFMRAGELCEPNSCATGERRCGGVCRPCPMPNVATTACNVSGTMCIAQSCEPGFMLSAGACVPLVCGSTQRLCAAACQACPSRSATTDCSGSMCVATSCQTGFMLTMGRCDPIVCMTGERLCGSTCSACPAANVLTTACNASGACVAATCAAGYTVAADGTCTPVVCATNQRFCGSACTACPTSNVLTTTCNGSMCRAATCASGSRVNATTGACDPFTCTSIQRACGTTCAACPSVGVATTACGGGDTCVAATCAADYMLSGTTCVPVVCPGTERSCGGACRTCPTSGVVTTVCSGPACLAATCQDGYGLSGGACIPMACSTGSLYCASACDLCPTTGGATYGCNGSICVARSCATGYRLMTGLPSGEDRCVASEWTMELVVADANGSFFPRNAAIALDPAGVVHVAYYLYPNIVHAIRTTTGWRAENVAPTMSGLASVRRLVVDALGNAHVIYRDFYQISSFDSTYAYHYVRVSPAGVTSMNISLGDERYLTESEGIALTADGAGDAHIAYTYSLPTVETRYRRTFAGAWLAPVGVGGALGGCSIRLDAGGDVLLGCESGSSISYTRGTASVFSAPVSVNALGANFDQTQIYPGAAAGSSEIWARTGRSFYSTAVSATGMLAAPIQWGALTGTPSYVQGARGTSEFSSLEQNSSSAPVLFRRGPTTGPTVLTATNLPVDRLLNAFVVDAAGYVHALARLPGRSTSLQNIYYLRGR